MSNAGITNPRGVIFPGKVITIPWRPNRPVTVNERMYEAALRLRPALIVTAMHRSTLTYRDVKVVIDDLYNPQGLGPLLDLISLDSQERGEPSLAALVVRADTGECGDGFVGKPGVAREECYKYWSAR
jgi:hypothetical protein